MPRGGGKQIGKANGGRRTRGETTGVEPAWWRSPAASSPSFVRQPRLCKLSLRQYGNGPLAKGCLQMRIVFLTRSIAGGGAQRQLLVLAQGLARRGHPCSIITFYAPDS